MRFPPPPIGKPVLTKLSALKPHQRNYRRHPEDQVQHLVASMRMHGFYRNVVAARDGTILAGHGVVIAAKEAGLEQIPVVKLDLAPDDPRAKHLLAADNKISHLAEDDDRALTDLLKECADEKLLLGTGFDEAMLANLLFVTRPSSEVGTIDEAGEYVGMPDFNPGVPTIKVMVMVGSKEDLEPLLKLLGNEDKAKAWKSGAITCWWPPKKSKDDVSSVKFKA